MKKGFTLVELLLALAVLAIGTTFVAGAFVVAIHFSTATTEQTIAAVVANEAFAKIQLYGKADISWLAELPPDSSVLLKDVIVIHADEFAYPSDPCNNIVRTKYCWSAICRRASEQLVQVTVFVNRKIGTNKTYWIRNADGTLASDFSYPIPVFIKVTVTGDADKLSIDNETTFVNGGHTIAEDSTGRLYQVLDRLRAPDDNIIVLNNDWQGGEWVWTIPHPVRGGKGPCIAAYQKVIRF